MHFLNRQLRRILSVSVCCLLLPWSGFVLNAMETEPWMVLDVEGGVKGFVQKQPLPRKISAAMVPLHLERMVVSPQSHAIVGAGDAIQVEGAFRIYLPPQAMVQWMHPSYFGFRLQKGAVRVVVNQRQEALQVELPHGLVHLKQADVILLRRQDGATVMKVDDGLAQVLVKEKFIDVEKPKKVIIDEHGVRVIEENLLERSRAIFDFTERPEILEQAMEEREREEGDKMVKGGEVDDITIRGKASNAELVEGNANGEAEYRWKNAMNPLYFLIPLIGIVAFVIWRKRAMAKAQAELAKQKSKAEPKDKSYESEDVHVIRNNITANDEPLVTHKETHILGDVEDGAVIEARHPLRIVGSFQGASLKASSHVSVEGGINGQNKAHMIIGGDLKASYISEAKVVCRGGVEVRKAIRNAEVVADGDIVVEEKNILGGFVSSLESISTPELGSDFCETQLELGRGASQIWQERCEEAVPWKSSDEFNRRASLKVIDEWFSALVIHGEAKLDQKKEIPGPVATKLDPTDLSKLQVAGFRKDEEGV